MNRRSFLKTTAAAAGSLALPAMAQPTLYVEGSHYVVLPANALARTQATSALPLVTEIFWYGCSHCHAFDPLLNAWIKEKNDKIAFSRVPAVWDAATKQHARLFAATIELGIHEEIHRNIFKAVHEERNLLLDEASQLAFLAHHGIEQTAAKKALASFEVDSQVRKAEALVRELKISGIPALIVHGQYLVNAATHQDQLNIAEHLLRMQS